MKSIGTMKLGDETFAVEQCIMWGYLSQHDGRWYCRWCIDAKAEKRTFTEADDGELYAYEVQPCLSANTIPIEVHSWRELDGKTFTTGEHDEGRFFYNDDRPAITLRTMTSFELCNNNSIKLEYVTDKQFRIHWTGQSYFHGVEGDRFELDTLATLTSVSLSGELVTWSDVDNTEIGRIFATVFPNGDFEQEAATVERTDDDSTVTYSFKAEFTPK